MSRDLGHRISLSLGEMQQGIAVGTRRQLDSVMAGGAETWQSRNGPSWTEHIEGALGELAVARLCDVYWDGAINVFGAPDLPGVQIRTRRLHQYELIVRDKESAGGRNDNTRYVLVTGRAPVLHVRGWIWGHEAKQPEYRKAPGSGEEAWFPPHSALHHVDPEDLRRWIRQCQKN